MISTPLGTSGTAVDRPVAAFVRHARNRRRASGRQARPSAAQVSTSASGRGTSPEKVPSASVSSRSPRRSRRPARGGRAAPPPAPWRAWSRARCAVGVGMSGNSHGATADQPVMTTPRLAAGPGARAAARPGSPSTGADRQDLVVEVVARVVDHAAAFAVAVADPDVAAGPASQHAGEILRAHGGRRIAVRRSLARPSPPRRRRRTRSPARC